MSDVSQYVGPASLSGDTVAHCGKLLVVAITAGAGSDMHIEHLTDAFAPSR